MERLKEMIKRLWDKDWKESKIRKNIIVLDNRLRVNKEELKLRIGNFWKFLCR